MFFAMKARIIVAAVIEKDGKILLGQKRKDIGPYPNTWHLPGGGVNLDSESLEDAMKREITEETGLDVSAIERIGFDEDYEPDKKGEMTHYVFLVFKVVPKTMQTNPGDDIITLQWFKKSELQNLSLARPTTKLFKELGWL